MVGHRTRQRENHLAFETMLTSVIPDDADELRLISTFLSNLLEVNRKAVRRCIQRGRDAFGYHGFASVLHTGIVEMEMAYNTNCT